MENPELLRIIKRLDKFEKALKDLKKQVKSSQDKDKNYKRSHVHNYVKRSSILGGFYIWKCSGCPKIVKSM